MISLRESLELFLLFKRAAGLRPKTIGEYRRYVDRLVAIVPPERSTVAGLLASDIARLMAGLSSSVHSIRAHYRAIDVFLNWCEDSDELGNPSNPLGHGRKRKVQPPKLTKKKPRSASQIDIFFLIDSIFPATWIDLRDRAIIRLLFDTGVRVSECVNLKVADVKLDGRSAFIVGGKGDKDRTVFFTQTLADMLSVYLFMLPQSPYDCLFASAVNDDGVVRGCLTIQGVQLMLKRRCKQAGLLPINPHSIRHLFGTRLLNEGMRLEAISALMGHYSVDFTKKYYAEWATEGLRREYDRHTK